MRALLGLTLAATLGLAAGCKENGNDYLDQGLKLLGEAERGVCKPEIIGGQATIDAGRVAECLDATKGALEQFHRARELGIDTTELENLIGKTEDEVARLESMLRTVSRMQHEK